MKYIRVLFPLKGYYTKILLCSNNIINVSLKLYICDASRNLVTFVQFKEREKHRWMSTNFRKVAG